MANINKIRLSGTTYEIQDLNATKTVELTQSEYDALSQKDPNVFYIITDAEAGDLSNYYTKTETSGATEISTALSSKSDTATTYTKTETDNAITAATSTKQDTLVSGTNIKTINNQSILGEGNITIEGGGGGGKAIEAGRGISITTGETADTVSFNLPISGLPKTTSAVTDNNLVIFGTGNSVDIESKNGQNLDSNIVYGNNNVLVLTGIKCSLQYNTIFGQGNEIDNNASLYASSDNNFVFGSNNKVYGNNNKYNLLFGDNNQMTSKIHVTVFGTGNNPKNQYETIFGKYSVSHSGSTDADKSLFSVGNGTSSSATHNAFEIRQNGDIYLTKDGQDVKLQDQLGGSGGSSYTAGDGIDITNDVISVTGLIETSAITTSISSSSTDAQVPSAKAVYDALQEGGGGGSITIDTSLDSGSTNPVANSAITTAFNTYTAFKDSISGTVRYWSWRTPNYPYGNVALWNFAINGKCPLSQENRVNSDIWQFNLVETSAITTSVTSSSTDSQVPSAKALYDIVGNIETLLSKI